MKPYDATDEPRGRRRRGSTSRPTCARSPTTRTPCPTSRALARHRRTAAPGRHDGRRRQGGLRRCGHRGAPLPREPRRHRRPQGHQHHQRDQRRGRRPQGARARTSSSCSSTRVRRRRRLAPPPQRQRRSVGSSTASTRDVNAIVSGHTHLAYNHTHRRSPRRLRRPVRHQPQPARLLGVDPVDRRRSPSNDQRQTASADRPTDWRSTDPGQPPPSAAEVQDDRRRRRRQGGRPRRGRSWARSPVRSTGPGSPTATENRGGESTLGNLVAEVQRWATSTPEAGAAQIAVHEPGRPPRRTCRWRPAATPPTLTYKQAAVVQSFANTLVNMKLTGAADQDGARAAVAARPDGTSCRSRPFLRLGVSKGFFATYDPTRARGRPGHGHVAQRQGDRAGHRRTP